MASQIAVGEFKAKCLKLLSEVSETGKPIVITKRGKPLAKVIPIASHKSVFGAMRGSGTIVGDIVSPLDVEWDAM